MISTQISKIKNIFIKAKNYSPVEMACDCDHEYKLEFLKQTTTCSHCSTDISGIQKQVYKCRNCQSTCHTDCMDRLPHDSLKDVCLEKHSFHRTSKMISFCDHCGKFICGLFQKVYECSNEQCQLQLHSSCRCLISQECSNLSTNKFGALVLNLLSFSTGSSLVIQIDVIEARNLIIPTQNRLPNLFCTFVLKYGSRVLETFATGIQNEAPNPHFDDSIIFNIQDDSKVELHITMYNKLKTKRMSFLGGMMLSLGDIKRYSTGTDITFSLLNRSKLARSFHHIAIPTQTDTPSHSLTLRDFSVKTRVGEGGFGTVYLANLEKCRTRAFAIKVFNKQRIEQEDLTNSLLVEHRVGLIPERPSFLAGILASFQDEENYYMVFDFFGGGDLLYHIYNEKLFLENRTRFYVAELSIALFFLHKRGIAYLDLKLENILLDNDGHIKLVDFGFCAEDVYNGRSHTSSPRGTLEYIAPEILENSPHDCGADLWSLGVLTYEMMLGRVPFSAESQQDMLDIILKEPPRIPQHLSEPARNFITSLLKINPEDRLGYDFESGFQNFRSAQFFSEIDWTKLENRVLTPPFVPRLHSLTATTYFDTTNEPLQVSNSSSSYSLESKASQVFNYTSPDIIALL